MKRILIHNGKAEEISIEPLPAALRPLEPGSTAVVIDGRVTRVTTANGRVLVNGREVAVELADPRNRRNGSGAGAAGGRRDIRAAMPGKVVRILAAAGDEVQPGQGLLILEAMKMQNEVRAPAAGRIAAIPVSKGETVAAGQTLATLE